MRSFCRTTVSLRLLMTLLASLGIGLHTAWAQINEWTSVGWLEGGSVQHLIIDSLNPNTVYATNAAAGIFKSTDGGANWRAVTFGLPITSVASLAINPQKPGTLYAGTWGRGVFKSTA